MLAFLLVALSAESASGCLTVDGPTIQARHLSVRLSAFSALAPETPLAAAPFPGAQRSVSRRELQAWLGAEPTPEPLPGSICIAWKTGLPDQVSVLRAMVKSGAMPAGAFRIVEISRVPVPDGELVFPAAGLSPALKDGLALWRGSVRYSKGRTMRIWARIQMQQTKTCLVAESTLRAGAVLRREDFSERSEYPRTGAACHSNEADVIGSVVRRTIPAGTTITARDLKLPPDIRRGEPVELEVRSGRAVLRIPATVEEDGRVGQRLFVRNPETGKRIGALLVAKTRAVADASAPGQATREPRGVTQ